MENEGNTECKEQLTNAPINIDSLIPSPSASLALGLNAVTRNLEKNNLAVVILSKKIQPSVLVQHIPVLCYQFNVPLCPIDEDSASLGKLVGLKKLIALGFKNDAIEHKQAVQKLIKFAIPLDIPWLPRKDTSALPTTTTSSTTTTTIVEMQDTNTSTVPNHKSIELAPIHYKRMKTEKDTLPKANIIINNNNNNNNDNENATSL